MLLIGAYYGTSLLSWKIKRETNSPVSHVSLLQLPDAVWDPLDGVRVNLLYPALETCPVWEAWGADGVVRRSGIHAGHTPGTRIDLMRIDPAVHVPEAAIAANLDAIVAAGTKYDWIGLLRYKWRLDRDNPGRMFCSELAHHVLSRHGVHLIRRRLPHQTAPGDLYISPLLEHLWRISTKNAANAPRTRRSPEPCVGAEKPAGKTCNGLQSEILPHPAFPPHRDAIRRKSTPDLPPEAADGSNGHRTRGGLSCNDHAMLKNNTKAQQENP